MVVKDRKISVATRGESDIADLTPQLEEFVNESGIRNGQVTVFVVGSTAAITTTEYEPGLTKDIPEALDRLAPRSLRYHHDDTWHDGNGHSHVRASLIGSSMVLPIMDGRLVHGTWQQVVLVECDTRGRHREIVFQAMGM